MKHFQEDLAYLGLSLRSQIIKYAIDFFGMAALDVILFFLLGPSFLLTFPALGFFLLVYFDVSSIGKRKKQKQERLGEEFVDLFTFFSIYIQDGFNVFHALESLRPFSSEEFLVPLEKLLSQIEQDKSVAPFIEFSSAFPDITIKEVMVSIFQMVEEGQGGPYIVSFQRLFGKLSDEKHKLAKEKKMASLESLSFLPLMGTGIVMLMLTMSLVEIMGGVINGI